MKALEGIRQGGAARETISGLLGQATQHDGVERRARLFGQRSRRAPGVSVREVGDEQSGAGRGEPRGCGEVPEVIQSLGKRVASEKAVLLVGMPTRSIEQDGELRRRYYNSLLHISEGATLTASGISYSKRHLVPFGEFMPFDALLRPITDLLNVPMSDFSAGAPQQSSLVADDIIFGASICYEDAYAELVRDALPAANVLVNISNDAWFGATIAPHQHLQISQMRALELGRYMLRATNTGISAVIDDKGQVIAKSKQFVPQALSAKFSLLNGVTPFARFGTTPIFFWCVLSAIVIFVQNRRSQE